MVEGLGIGIAALFTGVAVCILCYVIQRWKDGSAREATGPLPPGPWWGWPVIGHLPLLGRTPHEALTRLADKHGDVVWLKLGCWNTVALSGIDTIKQALVKQKGDFAGRPAFFTFNYIAQGKSMGFGDYGPRWKLHRRIAQNALGVFVNNKQHPIHDVIQDEASLLVNQLVEQSESVGGVNPHDEIYLSVGSIICNVCFGRKYQRDDEDFLRLIQMNAEFMEYAGAGNPIDVLPWIRHFTRSSFDGFLRILHAMEEFCQSKVQEHVKNYEAGTLRDVTDCLLKAVNEIPEKEKAEVGLTDSHILSTVQEMIGAGFDTIATTLQWSILYMVTNQEVQAKIQAEIDDLTNKQRSVTMSDMPDLPYTQACILEIMRLSCIFPLALPHSTTRPTTLNGFSIPADTLVFVNLWATTRDPTYFPDPESFQPERFLDDESGKPAKALEAFLPYSAGRRRCPGEQLAKSEIFLFFTTLLQKCNITAIEGETYNLKSKFGLTLKPHAFKVKVSSRV